MISLFLRIEAEMLSYSKGGDKPLVYTSGLFLLYYFVQPYFFFQKYIITMLKTL